MAYRFRKKDKSLAHGARRIAREQVDKAIAAIDGIDDPTDAVRNVRERCRRVISVIRLTGSAHLSAKKELRLFGKIQDELSGVSDLLGIEDVRQDAIQALREQPAKSSVSEMLDRNHLSATLERLRRRLVKSRKRIDKWEFEQLDIETLWEGLFDWREEARESHFSLDEPLYGDELHNFRKRVRTHWHHLRLFRSKGSETLLAGEKSARRLVDLLGKLRDTEMLEQRLAQAPASAADNQEAREIAVFCKRETTVLRGKCTTLTRDLLSVKREPVEAAYSSG